MTDDEQPDADHPPDVLRVLAKELDNRAEGYVQRNYPAKAQGLQEAADRAYELARDLEQTDDES